MGDVGTVAKTTAQTSFLLWKDKNRARLRFSFFFPFDVYYSSEGCDFGLTYEQHTILSGYHVKVILCESWSGSKILSRFLDVQ